VDTDPQSKVYSWRWKISSAVIQPVLLCLVVAYPPFLFLGRGEWSHAFFPFPICAARPPPRPRPPNSPSPSPCTARPSRPTNVRRVRWRRAPRFRVAAGWCLWRWEPSPRRSAPPARDTAAAPRRAMREFSVLVRRALSSLSLSEFLCAGQTTVPTPGNIEESLGFGNHSRIHRGGQ
jgi:hypothetical protein